MISAIKLIRAEGVYPYRNQAIEKYLLDTCAKGEMTLYLWANERTVFIGKNQNAYAECRTEALKADGGYLARRITGGGAVYHDGGNLNFTFVVPREDYNLSNQFSVIISAMKTLGFNAVASGRNDLLIDGKKFSGNAFYKSRGGCMHHGTILIRTPAGEVAKYLTASRVKLEAKGVKSVASRVCNLSDFRKDITAAEVADAVEKAFAERYPSARKERITESSLPPREIEKLTAEFANGEYILGDDKRFGMQFSCRFGWGTADVRIKFNGKVIEDARIYSDSLDTRGVELKEKLLKGTDVTLPPDPRIKDIIETIGALNDEV